LTASGRVPKIERTFNRRSAIFFPNPEDLYLESSIPPSLTIPGAARVDGDFGFEESDDPLRVEIVKYFMVDEQEYPL
jgi:hypothetical protein